MKKSLSEILQQLLDEDKKSDGIKPSEYLINLYENDKQSQLSGLEKLIEDIKNEEKNHEARQENQLSDMDRKLIQERLKIRNENFRKGW